jgi:threonine synthase
MSYASHLRCIGCGKEYPIDKVMNLCPEDNRPVEIIIDTDRLKVEKSDFQWYRPDIKSMWRFGGLLALDLNDDNDRANIVSLGEGYTPLIPLDAFPLASKLGFSLFLKDEGQPHPGYGRNPTGSFKDRGMSMVASMAKKLGLYQLAVPTQGNAGDSLTEYALHAGFEIVVAMPDDTPMPILGRVAAMEKMHSQVHLELVKGTIRDASELLKEKYISKGFFSTATFQEPGWRIEGKKTLGLELAEPIPGIKEKWSLPDVILYPTGGGTGILGMWKAFNELEAIGVIDSKRPRIIAVQSEATPPVVNAFKDGTDDSQLVNAGHTIAAGLNVPGGVGHFKVLEIIKESDGAAIAVSEENIRAQIKEIYQSRGIWICPEGAATLAALEPAYQMGLIEADSNVVAFNTGSFEKYLPNIRDIIFAVDEV